MISEALTAANMEIASLCSLVDSYVNYRLLGCDTCNFVDRYLLCEETEKLIGCFLNFKLVKIHEGCA
jgi:hypothetical protein